VAIFIVCCAGLFIIEYLHAPSDLPTTDSTWEGESGAVLFVAFVIGAFFALASAVRTVRPQFHMTVGRLLGTIGWSLVAGVATMAGLILLIVPGLYIGVKLSLAPYFYLLDPGTNPVATAWARTGGAFWYTALMLFAVGAIVEAVSYAVALAIGALAVVSPMTAIVSVPLAFGLFFALLQFQYNALVRWADALPTATQA